MVPLFFWVRNLRSNGLKKMAKRRPLLISGEQSCQVAALDFAHRVPGYLRDQVDLLGHFEIGRFGDGRTKCTCANLA
jgi:hypothetical protein